MSSTEERVGLHIDYLMVDHKGMSGEDIVILRERANWGTEHDADLWQRVIDDSIASVGIIGPRGNLVGAGFLAGNERHAVLCDLVVNPNHRGLGIGKSIIRRRIEIAEQKNIPYLYTELAPTNNLSSFYEQLGFVATGKAFTRATRQHPSELE